MTGPLFYQFTNLFASEIPDNLFVFRFTPSHKCRNQSLEELASGVGVLVECLPSIHKALGSIPRVPNSRSKAIRIQGLFCYLVRSSPAWNRSCTEVYCGAYALGESPCTCVECVLYPECLGPVVILIQDFVDGVGQGWNVSIYIIRYLGPKSNYAIHSFHMQLKSDFTHLQHTGFSLRPDVAFSTCSARSPQFQIFKSGTLNLYHISTANSACEGSRLDRKPHGIGINRSHILIQSICYGCS